MNKFLIVVLISISGWGQTALRTPLQMEADQLRDLRGDAGAELRNQWPGPPQNTFGSAPLEIPAPRTEERPTGQTISVGQLQHKVSKEENRSFKQAMKRSTAGEHGKAAAELEKLVRQDPKLSWAYNQLGVEYALSRRFADAVGALRRSLELEPGSWQAHYNLGLVLYDMGDLPGAEQCARRALQFSSQNPQVHLFLGYLLLLREETRRQGLEEVKFAARTMAAARDLLRTVGAR